MRYVSVLVLWSSLAMAAGVEVTDATDRQILDAFLRHAEGSAVRCTPDRMAEFAAQPEDITWQASKYIRMPFVAWRLTGDEKYFAMFGRRLDALLGSLTKGPDGFMGWYGLPLKLFRHPEHPGRKVDVMLTSFTAAHLLADFACAVRHTPSLQATHGKRAEEYLALARDHLVKKWDSRGCYKDLGQRGAVYVTHPDLKPVKGSLTQPHNKHAKIIAALLRLYAATGSDAYLAKAVKLGTRFKRCLRLVDGHYKWNYWDPAGAWDVDPANPAKWKHWIGAEHRGGYYALTLSQAVMLYEHGLVFDRTDIVRFLKTQTTVCWNGDEANPRWRRVDGRASRSAYLCSALAPFDERIFRLEFGGAAQQERLKRRDHSWQGGVVAMSWLEAKLLTVPRWRGGEPAEAESVEAFLAKAANRSLVESLAFTVTPPGYTAPATPAEMRPMPGAAPAKQP